jgi:transketolase
MTVIRPADANETSAAWAAALRNTRGPTVLALTRQNLPVYDRTAAGMGQAEELARGGYSLFEQTDGEPEIILIASGSEVEIAYEAAKTLAGEGIGVRVVSLPCWELFEAQDEAYRAKLLPAGTPKLAIEAATPFGWARWVGNDPAKGDVLGIDRFGASAPYQRIYEGLGLTPANAVARAKRLLGH